MLTHPKPPEEPTPPPTPKPAPPQQEVKPGKEPFYHWAGGGGVDVFENTYYASGLVIKKENSCRT